LAGLVLVFGIVTYEFVSELVDEKSKEKVSEPLGIVGQKMIDN